jgi:hypothetical protein
VGTANYKSLKEIKGILFNFVGVKAWNALEAVLVTTLYQSEKVTRFNAHSLIKIVCILLI